MKKIIYLAIAIIGNALGTALMAETNLGMTAWGSSSLNVSNFFNVSLGTGFIILSILFYLTAVVIRKKFIFIEAVESTIFLLSFSFLADFFIFLIPSFTEVSYVFRMFINMLGMLILLFSIAVHINVNIAVHPMDVFLSAMQKQFNSVSMGTYYSYFIAFGIAIIFGLLNNNIEGIREGTFITLIMSGYIMHFYNKYILYKWDFS